MCFALKQFLKVNDQLFVYVYLFIIITRIKEFIRNITQCNFSIYETKKSVIII